MSSSFAALGDSLHAFSALNTFLFAVAVAQFSHKFDGEWAEDGFCVVNKDVPHLTSHDWCAYLDVILATVCAIVFLALRNKPGMSSANDLVKFNIPGIIGHGIGHYFIGKGIRDGYVSSENNTPADAFKDMEWGELIKLQVPFLIFWLCLLKASCVNFSLRTISVMSVIAQASSVVVPNQFQFTYVQTVLMLAFSANQTSRPKKTKDFEYALFPAISAIPLGFVAWLESSACSTPLVQALYGHVMYDVYIPLGILAFYGISYARQRKLHGASSTKKLL